MSVTRWLSPGEVIGDGQDGATLVWRDFVQVAIVASSKDTGGQTVATGQPTAGAPTPSLFNNNGLVRMAVFNTVLWGPFPNTPGASLVLKSDGTLAMEDGAKR